MPAQPIFNINHRTLRVTQFSSKKSDNFIKRVAKDTVTGVVPPKIEKDNYSENRVENDTATEVAPPRRYSPEITKWRLVQKHANLPQPQPLVRVTAKAGYEKKDNFKTA